MTGVLASTTNVAILTAATSILERALSDSTYTFPSSGFPSSESNTSLNHKSHTASISSASMNGGGVPNASEQVLEDLGMKGLAEMNFPAVRMER